ncbi:MAG: hypothetical protein RLZZ292_3734 [Bacteroidota bacterium]|jgi:hypothetical protein
MRKTIYFLLLLTYSLRVSSQTVFHTEDITNFYAAFDSVQTTTDKAKQVAFVQKIYIDKGSLGVKYAIDSSDSGRKFDATHWVEMINNSRENLLRIRPYFANLAAQQRILEQKFVYFKELYPDFKDGNVYFVIGVGIFGGRPTGNNLIIGCELMAKNTDDWAVSVVLHEFVHTLQNRSNDALLAHSINEGACDFIAEVVNQKSLRESYPNGYIDFGYKNEKAVWKAYKEYIYSNEKGRFFDWLYGQKGVAINGTTMKDLGYFMGYLFCKSYYESAVNKRQAIKEIIEYDVSTDEKAKAFLIKSNYGTKKDARFIKNLQFSKKTMQGKKVKLVVSGYKIDKENVFFTFQLPPSFDKKTINSVTIAGTFNGWNPQDLNYKMTATKENTYEFIMPKANFKTQNHEFKFVINGDNWQNIPENAINTNNGNLTLEIK